MANLVLNRSDRFPVGTSVGAYPILAHQSGGAPAGTALETQTVANDGSLTYTTLPSGAGYVVYAKVGSSHFYVRCFNDHYTAPGNLKTRLAARAH